MVVVDGLEPLLVLADKAEESRPESLQGLEHRQGDRALLHGDPEVPGDGTCQLISWMETNFCCEFISYQSSWFMYCSMADWPALNMCMSSGLWRRMAPLTRYLVKGWRVEESWFEIGSNFIWSLTFSNGPIWIGLR